MGEDERVSDEGRCHIAVVGDYNPAVVAHQGINRTLTLAAKTEPSLSWSWIHTNSLGHHPAERLTGFAGIWVVPASPYTNTDGAIGAVRFARENGVPFLGTCGAFQHAILEYARNVLHTHHAAHAELEPEATQAIIAPLRCSLIEKSGAVYPVADGPFASLFSPGADEGYHCSFGLNREHEGLFGAGPLAIAARDEDGEVRAMALDGHPFYLITLFQPERAGLTGRVHPVVDAFLQAASVETLRQAAEKPRVHSGGA